MSGIVFAYAAYEDARRDEWTPSPLGALPWVFGLFLLVVGLVMSLINLNKSTPGK
jgi:hypothetical protein